MLRIPETNFLHHIKSSQLAYSGDLPAAVATRRAALSAMLICCPSSADLPQRLDKKVCVCVSGGAGGYERALTRYPGRTTSGSHRLTRVPVRPSRVRDSYCPQHSRISSW